MTSTFGPRRRLIVISQLPPPRHGSTIMTAVLLDTLRAEGLSVELVDKRFSADISSVGRFRPAKVLRAVGLAVRLLRAATRRPDTAILFLTTRPGSFLVDTALLAVLRALRIPVIGYVHTRGFTALAARGRVWRGLVRGVLGACRRIVTLSPILVDDLTPWVARDCVRIIPNTPRELPPGPSAGDAVLFLSNLLPEKGVADFVDAARLVARTDPSIRFVIAGDAPDPVILADLRRVVAEEGLPVRVVGAVDDAAKWHELSDASLLVFPSTYALEAQPLTIVEAMACGVPTIAYPTGGIVDLIDDGSTGLLVRTGDTDGLAAAIAQLRRDTSRRDAMAAACRARFEADFSASRYRRRWAALLGESDRGTRESG